MKHFKLNLIEQLVEKSPEEMFDLERTLLEKKLAKNKGKRDSSYDYLNVAHSPVIPKKKNFETDLNEENMSCELSRSADQFQSNAKSSKINFYRVYKGCLYFKIRNGTNSKKADNAEMYTCNNVDLIRSFGAISSKLYLSTKITLNEFEKYIQKCNNNGEYSLLPGWLRLAAKTTNACKNYLEKNLVVASSQYTKKCKIFVFTKAQTNTSYFNQFLSTHNFILAREETEAIDLLFIAVLKKNRKQLRSADVPGIGNQIFV